MVTSAEFQAARRALLACTDADWAFLRRWIVRWAFSTACGITFVDGAYKSRTNMRAHRPKVILAITYTDTSVATHQRALTLLKSLVV